MGKNDLRFDAISGWRVHRRTINGVATRRVAAVCPIERPIRGVEVEIDWLGQIVIKKFNVTAVRG